MDAVELEVRAILDGWDRLTIENKGPFWIVAGIDPHGTPRAGSRDDVVSLAADLAALAVAPAPEPVSVAPDTSSATLDTSDAASEDAPAPPAAEEDGSLYAALYEIDADGAHPSGIGVMVNNTGGVMAADRTEELRAKKIGETVMEHRRLVDASYTVEEAHALQQLRSRSNAAADGTGLPLTDEEQRELDRLALEEAWAARMDTELQRRLATLSGADADALTAYSPRGDWPA